MPIYEYICRDCNERFEYFWMSMAAAAGKMPLCPACESTATQRIISQVAVLGGTPGEQSETSSAQEAPIPAASAEQNAPITPKEQIQKLQANRQKKRESGV